MTKNELRLCSEEAMRAIMPILRANPSLAAIVIIHAPIEESAVCALEMLSFTKTQTMAEHMLEGALEEATESQGEAIVLRTH